MNKYFLRFNISLWEFGRKNAAILRHPYPQLKKKNLLWMEKEGKFEPAHLFTFKIFKWGVYVN